jgi:rhodanese-related sulfurtransferase
MNYNKIISPDQLQQMLERKEEPIVIDIREQISYFKPIQGAEHIPASQINNFISKLNKSKAIVLYCRHGVDSFFIMNMLSIDYGFKNVYSLKGGIEAWYKFKKI